MAHNLYDFDLLCIGSGPAGQRAAIQAAKLGKKVALVERRRILGGVCVETGTIPSKTFREAVLSFNLVAYHFDQLMGYRYQSRATAGQLFARVEEVVRREVEVVTEQLRRNDVALFNGDAAFHEPHTVTVTAEDGARAITAANILITVGTMPALTDGVKFDAEIILNSDDVPRVKQLPRHIVVVGGGII